MKHQRTTTSVADYSWTILLNNFLGPEIDQEEFWQLIESISRFLAAVFALSSLQIKLRPEVIKMIEFLNSELRNVDMFGLELRCYGNSDKEYVMTPRIVGHNVTDSERKQQHTRGKKWTVAALHEWIDSAPDTIEKHRFEALLNETVNNGKFLEGTSKLNPLFGITSASNCRVVSIWPKGVYVVFNPERYGINPRIVASFLEELQSLELFDAKNKLDDITDGRICSVGLNDMSVEQFEGLHALLKKFLLSP